MQLRGAKASSRRENVASPSKRFDATTHLYSCLSVPARYIGDVHAFGITNVLPSMHFASFGSAHRRNSSVSSYPHGVRHTMSSTTTGIEWTNATWNPMTGCTKVTAGCDHCYAYTLSQSKTRAVYLAKDPVKDTPANRKDPFAPRFWPERLRQPLSWRAPKRIFVNSMSDVFHSHFTFEQIRQVFEVMNEASHHQFQLLTKRPERALRYADRLKWTSNIWIGTSIENMDVAHRADAIRGIKAASVRFISAEPLLGPLDKLNLEGIHWVIGGGESGSGYRRVEEAWALGLRDLCTRKRVAFFWKQWGGFTPKAGGRELDGRTYDEYPVELPA